MDETLSSSGNNIHGKNNLILEKKNLPNRNTRKNPGKPVTQQRFSKNILRPTTSPQPERKGRERWSARVETSLSSAIHELSNARWE